jgi:molybdopterin converting factor small subunit
MPVDGNGEEKINITIELFGVFRINRFKEESGRYRPGITSREIFQDLRLPQQLLGIVVINGVHAGVDDVLHDGDTLSLFPLLCGG